MNYPPILVSGFIRPLHVEQDGSDDGSERKDAEQFLADLLKEGGLPVRQIKADADGAGYSWSTIRRAQKSLGIEAVKEKGAKNGGWRWLLPNGKLRRCSNNAEDAQGAQEKNVSILSTFTKNEHLQENNIASDVSFVEIEL